MLASRCGLEVVDLGRMDYAKALARQRESQEELIRARRSSDGRVGTIYLVEHPPVITVTSRPSAAGHVLADRQRLARLGVELHPTDRGGDVTYHGPGQIVAYPILNLERLAGPSASPVGPDASHAGSKARHLGLHGYMRLLEQAAIDTIGHWGVTGQRDASATGVWVPMGHPGEPASSAGEPTLAKIAAMGVRVRKWVTMHGLALNVEPDLTHFQLIVPCGLAGRPVTSMRAVLGNQAPGMEEAKAVLAAKLIELIESVATVRS